MGARNDKYNGDATARLDKIASNLALITANEADIYARREKIEANREGITTNGTKVAEMLKNACGPSAEDVDAIKALSAEDKAAVAEALAAPPPAEDAKIAENRALIAENEATLHQLYLDVMTNKEKL